MPSSVANKLSTGARFRSVDSSAPSILRSWVRIPRTPFTFFTIIVYCITYICHCIEKGTKINKKRLDLAIFTLSYLITWATSLSGGFHTFKRRREWWDLSFKEKDLFISTYFSSILLSAHISILSTSVTRLGNLLNFGQPFKAFGNN